MPLDTLSALLGWCLLINLGMYLVTVVAVAYGRRLILRLHGARFGLDPGTLPTILYGFVGLYKLLIIVFNLAPWLAIQIMR
jgi:hypothetical protein